VGHFLWNTLRVAVISKVGDPHSVLGL